MFHASWCGWCHKMDASMNDASVKKFLTTICSPSFGSDGIGRKENLENPGAADMMAKYHGDKSGIPYWLVFDTNGMLLADSKMRPEGGGPETGDNIGCPATEKEVAYFVDILENHHWRWLNLIWLQNDSGRTRRTRLWNRPPVQQVCSGGPWGPESPFLFSRITIRSQISVTWLRSWLEIKYVMFALFTFRQEKILNADLRSRVEVFKRLVKA